MKNIDWNSCYDSDDCLITKIGMVLWMWNQVLIDCIDKKSIRMLLLWPSMILNLPGIVIGLPLVIIGMMYDMTLEA